MTGITCAVAGSGSFPINNVVTVGTFDFGSGDIAYGYSIYEGSLANPIWNGKTINALEWHTAYSVFPSNLYFRVDGQAVDALWITMNIDGNTFDRSSASYSYSGSQTTWTWTSVSNPFGTTVGATKTVTWI